MADYLQMTLAERQAIDALNDATSSDLARRWLALEDRLAGAVANLTIEIASLNKNGQRVPASTLMLMNQYQQLLYQLRQALAEYGGYAVPLIERHQLGAAQLGHNGARRMLRKIGVAPRQIAILPDAVLLQIAEATRAGAPLASLIDAAYPLAAESILKELGAGIAAGNNPRQIAARVKRAGLAPGLDHILLVARDQGVRTWRESSRRQYAANGVRQYRRTASRQKRTCAVCLALDGTIYDSAEIMPLHPQCRCVLVPIVPGFPAPRIQSGADWFGALDQDDQRDILGPARFKQYQAGRPLADMVQIDSGGIWGDTPRLAPLR